jgi:hypothetical protein
MAEVLFVAAILLLLIGAMGFYFYSRMTYTEKKINLLETILLDIKMMMEMEEPNHLRMQHVPPAPKNIVLSEPEGVQPSEVEELREEVREDNSGYYASVIDSLAKDAPVNLSTMAVPSTMSVTGLTGVTNALDYESLNRDDLATLAEKRSLRVTKRMNRQTLLALLRESDKNNSTTTEQVTDVAGAVPDAETGAPLDGSEVISSETI